MHFPALVPAFMQSQIFIEHLLCAWYWIRCWRHGGSWRKIQSPPSWDFPGSGSLTDLNKPSECSKGEVQAEWVWDRGTSHNLASWGRLLWRNDEFKPSFPCACSGHPEYLVNGRSSKLGTLSTTWPYCTGNYIQYPVINHSRKEYMSHFGV